MDGFNEQKIHFLAVGLACRGYQFSSTGQYYFMKDEPLKTRIELHHAGKESTIPEKNPALQLSVSIDNNNPAIKELLKLLREKYAIVIEDDQNENGFKFTYDVNFTANNRILLMSNVASKSKSASEMINFFLDKMKKIKSARQEYDQAIEKI